MKMISFALLLLSILFQSCNGQSASKEVYNPAFKWTIKIPAGFDTVPPDQSQRLQNKGAEAFEKTLGTKVEIETTTLFVFRSDRFNYIESNYQPFDPKKDGNFLESFRDMGNLVYGTFEAQMPKATLDSAFFEETIGGKLFQGFKVTITIPDRVIMEMLTYSRLFGNKELTVNMMTVDKEKQKLLLDAWRKSTFK